MISPEINLMTLPVAQSIIGTSRTPFFRFRERHKIRTLTGQLICGADIIAAFEAERGREHLPDACGLSLGEYCAQLLTLEEAAAKYGWSMATLLRFRGKHHVQKLSFGLVHGDDLTRGLNAERQETC